MAGVATCKDVEAALALLNFALNAATIGSLTNARQDRTHCFDQVDTHLGWSELESSLDHVIAIGVAHEFLELVGVHQLLHHHRLGGWIRAAHALFDHVGTELLLGELSNLALKSVAKRVCEAWLVKIQDVLNDVVAKWVLHKIEAVVGNLANQLHFLEAGSMINASLKDAATMTVSANSNAVFTNGIKDELGILGLEVVEAFLDDMVTVQVLNEIDDSVTESVHDGLNLDFVSYLCKSASEVEDIPAQAWR